MNKNKLVDLVQLIGFQTKEQYRTILVLGLANSGKTKFAKLLAKRIKAKYIDLLDIFLNDKRLSDTIDTFTVSTFKKYLLNLPVDEAIIIVDNIDFLLNTWSDREQGEFLNLVEKLRSNETQKTFCFFAQDSKKLSSKQIYNSQNYNRILTMNHIAYIREDS